MDKHMEKWHFYYLEYYYAEHDMYCICLCHLWSFSSVLNIPSPRSSSFNGEFISREGNS